MVDSEGYVTLHSEAPLEDGEVEVVVNPIASRPPPGSARPPSTEGTDGGVNGGDDGFEPFSSSSSSRSCCYYFLGKKTEASQNLGTSCFIKYVWSVK